MSLPKINEQDTFTQIELLSGKKIGIKPWRVKEEKELLFAVEGITNDEDGRKEIVKFIKKCVDNPTLFDSLSNTDYIDLLVNLRKLSKGSTIEYNFRCQGTVNDKPCRFELSDDVNLNSNVVRKKFDPTPIKVSENLTVAIKEVPYTEYMKLQEKYEKVTEFNYYFILYSIESIVFKGEVYEEFTIEELDEFLEQLSSTEYEEMVGKIESAGAEIVLRKTLKCGRCGHENEVEFGDLYSFLAF